MSLSSSCQNLGMSVTPVDFSYMGFIYNETCGMSWKMIYSKSTKNLGTQTWSREHESVLEEMQIPIVTPHESLKIFLYSSLFKLMSSSCGEGVALMCALKLMSLKSFAFLSMI